MTQNMESAFVRSAVILLFSLQVAVKLTHENADDFTHGSDY